MKLTFVLKRSAKSFIIEWVWVKLEIYFECK